MVGAKDSNVMPHTWKLTSNVHQLLSHLIWDEIPRHGVVLRLLSPERTTARRVTIGKTLSVPIQPTMTVATDCHKQSISGQLGSSREEVEAWLFHGTDDIDAVLRDGFKTV